MGFGPEQQIAGLAEKLREGGRRGRRPHEPRGASGPGVGGVRVSGPPNDPPQTGTEKNQVPRAASTLTRAQLSLSHWTSLTND